MNRALAFFSTRVLVLLLALATTAQAAPKPLRAGAATANISPWMGLSINGGMADHKVQQVHDELHARALVLGDGDTQLAFVTCDSCMVPREVIERAMSKVRELTGAPPDHVLISATHAHSCPASTAVFQSDPDPAYTEFLATRIADAVARAVRNMAPARIGWGVGHNDRQVNNRRWLMKPGTIPADPFGKTTDRAKMNPPVGSPDLIEPAGPIDPEVPVIFVETTAGKPLALLANYSLHYVGGVGGGTASADYYGAFCDRVQQLLNADRLDPPFVGIMTNGTSGDINNVNFRQKRPAQPPFAQIRHVADDLALEAVRVARGLSFVDAVELGAATKELELGVRLPSPEEVSRAEAVLAKARGRELNGVAEIYARETVLIDKYPKTVPVTIQAMRIGDLGVAAIPCEVFVEIGLEIKAKSPFRPTFAVSLANGYNGYLPTEKHHALGGYETWRARSSYLEVPAASKITATALELLKSLHDDPAP